MNPVTVHPAALGDLLHSDAVRADLVRRANLVRARAAATAPRSRTAPDAGHLAASHRVEVHSGPSRVAVRVVAATSYADRVAATNGYLAAALDAGRR